VLLSKNQNKKKTQEKEEKYIKENQKFGNLLVATN